MSSMDLAVVVSAARRCAMAIEDELQDFPGESAYGAVLLGCMIAIATDLWLARRPGISMAEIEHTLEEMCAVAIATLDQADQVAGHA